MWGLLVLLVVGGACGMEDPPRYVQARTAFTHSRLYLQESVPRERKNIIDPVARAHFAFGIVAAVTGSIAQNQSAGGSDQHALAIFDKWVPQAWENYNNVADNVNQLLAEANLKIQPITNLMDVICSTTNSVDQCNRLVQDKVSQSNAYIQHKANLLLALGGVSDTIASHELELNSAAKEYTVVPYLLEQIETQPYKELIKALVKAYILLRRSIPQATY
ncbi:uncharacterized protein LOC123864736 [Maniola jurtina]|uniref:uncharacterized protein LOC123864736 n=1 Tax=Maniola jurtina TaxID=191418 RepID=UPI001E68C739|nr:uncharacterized protein LOC123864736 [Maniola jurtina]